MNPFKNKCCYKLVTKHWVLSMCANYHVLQDTLTVPYILWKYNLPCVPVAVSHSVVCEVSGSTKFIEQVVVLVLLSSDFSSVSVGATKPGLMVAVP